MARKKTVKRGAMTVFILGAGVMQIPAIEIARSLGWRVVAADANPEAPGVALVDRFIHVDLKDREGLLAAARALSADGGLDAVFTAGTDFSANVAYLAHELGLAGHSPEAALAASDKPRMRAALLSASVPSPRFVELSQTDQVEKALAHAGLAYPLVVKPADNMGARGCRLVGSDSELAEALMDALPHSRTGRAIVEEYLEGPEFSIDALVEDGAIHIRGIADRHVTFAPYFVELGHTMPSVQPQAVQDEVLRVFCAGVRALGLSHGAAKGDIKYCPGRGGAYVGEIAARLSGGYMSGWTYPYASGIEVTRSALELALGLPMSPSSADRGWHSAERAFISIPGRVAAIHGLRAARQTPYVKDVFVRVAPGDAVVFPSNNVEKCGNVISQAPTHDAAVRAASDAIRGLLVRLAPNEGRTEAFLRGEGRLMNPEGGSWPPQAFSPVEPASVALFREVAAMPEYDVVSPPAAPAAQARTPRIAVRQLSPALEAAALLIAPDWSGRTLLESAALALALAGATYARDPVPGTTVLAGRFWRALIAGGAQAALYVLDSEAVTGARG